MTKTPIPEDNRPPSSLEVRDLRLVEAILAGGNLTRAGLALHLTQSALSHQLADLERRMGTPLFHRMGRRLAPTPAGERLGESARVLLEDLRRTEREVRSVASVNEAVLRVCTGCYTCYSWLPQVLAKLHADFPAVSTEIVPDATRSPIDALLENEVDVAIVCRRVRDRRIEYTPLFSDEFVAIAATLHEWSGRAFIEPVDFASQHLIKHERTLPGRTLAEDMLLPFEIAPKRVSVAQLSEALFEMVSAGLGVAVVSRWLALPWVESGAIIARPLTARGVWRPWSAAFLRRPQIPAYVERFTEILATMPTMLLPSRSGRAPRAGAVVRGRFARQRDGATPNSRRKA